MLTHGTGIVSQTSSTNVHCSTLLSPYSHRFPDADMAISSEVCKPWASFEGDFVKWKPGDVFVQNIGQVCSMCELWPSRGSFQHSVDSS